jgi:hypothetical protein
MSEFLGDMASGFGDIAGDLGNSYQDILLQDSPIQYRAPEVEEGESFPGVEAPQPMTGETMMPESGVEPAQDNLVGLEQTIDADYQMMPEPEALPAPDVAAPETDNSPDIGMDDMDGPESP